MSTNKASSQKNSSLMPPFTRNYRTPRSECFFGKQLVLLNDENPKEDKMWPIKAIATAVIMNQSPSKRTKPLSQEAFKRLCWFKPSNLEELAFLLWPIDELLKDEITQRLNVSEQEVKDFALKTAYKRCSRNITQLEIYRLACCLAAGAHFETIQEKFIKYLAHRFNSPAHIAQSVWNSLEPITQKHLFFILLQSTIPKKH